MCPRHGKYGVVDWDSEYDEEQAHQELIELYIIGAMFIASLIFGMVLLILYNGVW